jgi:hypothetical protein
VAIRKAINNRNARAGTAARPYTEFFLQVARLVRNYLTSRCAVECGVGGPLAGLVSFRILQASTHSAAGRAGTILDGNIRNRNPNLLHPPSGMVDPLGHQTVRPSPAEPRGQRDFAYHPATSARTRCIHRVSVNQTLPIVCNRISKCAGGHSGPPLRGVFSTSGQIGMDNPNSAMRGGMWSGWAASRTGQLSDTASQHPFGGWQGGHHRRWSKPTYRHEITQS